VLSINGPEFIALVVIALVVIGPERLPHYAQQLGRTVRELRRMALGARDQVKAELGEDFDDLDWQKLDPRQYDPRRIVKEALSDVWDDEPVTAAGGGAAAAAARRRAARTGSTAAGEKPPRPKVNPNQRSSAGPRSGSTAAAKKAASAGAVSPPSLEKPAGRPGTRPGGGASRPGDVTGPAPFDLEAT
jgi:sec-independent protein translocase protein TatB